MIGFTRVVILMLSSYFSCVYKNNILKLFCRITMAISPHAPAAIVVLPQPRDHT